MLALFWGERSGRGSDRDRVRRAERRGAAVRRGHRPAIEELEARIALATDVWTGLGADTNWMTPANWTNHVAPVAGDDLVFPAGVPPASLTNNNNFTGGTTFHSITIGASGYDLTGNSLDLSSGITANYTSGTSTYGIVTILTSASTPISVASGATLAIPNLLAGSVGLGISGGGTLVLGGVNSYTGTTTVASGTTLLVDGTISGGVQLNGNLGGNGTVGTVTSVGGTISPGHSTPSTPAPGVLTVAPNASVTLDGGSTFATVLDGTSPGNGSSGFSQLVVSPPTGTGTGLVNLGGARLNATLGSGYSPTPGDHLAIISNGGGSAVNGIFGGLPEGGAVSAGSSLFRISYSGGASGHDMVLTNVSSASTTALAPITTPVTYGQSIILGATVTGTNGTPTGIVEFFDGSPIAGGKEIASAAVNGGTATTTIANLGVSGSPHQIYALYVPAATSFVYAGSTSAPQSVTVNPATLTVTGVTAENKQYDATTTATIDTAGATLNGVLNGDQVTLNTLNVVGTFASPGVGTNIPVTVTGLSLSGTGSTNYVLRQPTGLTANITPAPLTLIADNKTMNAGGPVPTLTFTAVGLQGTDTTAVLTSQPTLTTTATSSSPPGTYPINISGGSAANYTITDVPGTLTVVTSFGTTTTLASSSPLAVVGQPVTFTATVAPVSPGVGTPTGTVAFYADNSLIGFSALNASTGQASFTTSSLGFGSHSIVAVFFANSPFQSSISSTLTQVVSSAGTSPALTLVPLRNRFGKVTKVELLVQVQPTPPGAGTPTGTVTYYINGRASYFTVFLTSGTASIAMAPQRLVNKYVYVRYNGTHSFIGSASPNVYLSPRKLVELSKTGSSGGLRVAARRDPVPHSFRAR
jgi:autotransporter-associated beta strand protein